MAAKSPNLSNAADRPASQQGSKAPNASKQAVAGKADAFNAVVSDQQWLEQSQQVWAEQRAKELELARAEKSGDRVLQLLEGEQLGDVTGQSLVLAQANTSEDDRKAAAAKAESDRKAAALKQEDDDGGYLWPILGLGLLAAAAGRSGGNATPGEPEPEPRVAGEELLVYSNEEEEDGGDRSESGDTDTNTDDGPYGTVRVAAYGDNDTASLDDDGDGDGGSLYVEFADRTDLLLEVSADGDNSTASADISTDVSFSGEMNVHASGDEAFSSLDFYTWTSGEATHSIDMTVVADGVLSDVDVSVDLNGDGGIEASFDAVVSADGESSDIALNVYVTSDSADALLSGDISINVSGSTADAYATVDVWSSNDDATFIGSLEVTTASESAEADLEVYVEVEDEDSDTNAAMVSADIRVTVKDGSENASADADIEVSVESIGEALYSGDVDVTTERGSSYSLASLEIDLYGEDGYAHYSGDVLVSTDGVSTDAFADISLEGDVTEMEGHIELVAGARDSCADINIGMCADEDAWIWGSTTEVYETNDAEGVVVSTENDVAAEWSVLAKAQDNSAEFSAEISVDDYISAELNVTVQATWTSAEAEAVISMDANYIDLQGDEAVSLTSTDYSDEVSLIQGEDYSQTVEAAQFSSSVNAADASSDLSLDLYADNSVEAHVNFLVDAQGRDSDAETDVYVCADTFVLMAGGWASSEISTSTETWAIDAGDDENLTASREVFVEGEDNQIQAAEWVATASGESADADFNLTVEGDNSFNVDLYADMSAEATNEGGARISIDLNDSDLLDVYIGGDTSLYFSADSAYVSDDALDNLVGEDISFTIASAEEAASWTVTAEEGGIASMDVDIDAGGSVDLHVSMLASVDADSSAEIDLGVYADRAVLIGGAISGSYELEISSSESDVFEQYSVGEDGSTTYEAASWAALVSGDSACADIYVDIDNTSGTQDFDVIVSADLMTVASGTESTAEINVEIDADNYLAFSGGENDTFSYIDAQPSEDASVDFATWVSTEYAADWQATASGVDSYSSIDVNVSGDDIDFRVDLTMTASGADGMAGIDIELDASDEIYVSGEVTYSVGEDNSSDNDYSSTDTQNAVWTLSASGDGSLADFEFDADAASIDLDVDITANATGADSVASVDISADASVDMNMGWEDDANITITATGSNSLAYASIDLFGQDVGFDGNITVEANSASGLDADAVMRLNLEASSDSYFYGDINVSALNEDDDATLVMHVAGLDSADVGGNIYVKAVEGIASVSVSVDDDFDSFVSLDADEGGQVVMTIVADTVSTGDIYVYTDNDGVVTLNMDVNDYDGTEDIDVYGDEGGVFNLVLQDGFDVSVDLSDDVQGYAGQFNLVVETPLNISEGEDSFYSIEIEGFDATGLVIDTIDFKGAEFNGTYIDATTYNGTGVSDEYKNVYDGTPEVVAVVGVVAVSDDPDTLDVDETVVGVEAVVGVPATGGFTDFLVDAEEALDGDVDYFFGTNGTDGWLAVDGDGDGVDYVITLQGVTVLDWASVLSTQGQYNDVPG